MSTNPKTATLASYGIETAADIIEYKVLVVPGFGPALTANLLAWREKQESKFRYNPSPDASDIQAENAVRAADAAKRSDLQSKILSGIVAYEGAPKRLSLRTQMGDQQLMRAQESRARAARDLEILGLPIPPDIPITIVSKPRPITTPQPTATHLGHSSIGVPSCPICGSRMIQRTARRGSRSGHKFWGCPRYPVCRGTRN